MHLYGGHTPRVVGGAFQLSVGANQVTWEQRALAGDPKYMSSQYIPYAEYAKLLGLTGIYCEKPRRSATRWDQALSANRPVVVEFKVDPETPPLPPHIMKTQAKNAGGVQAVADVDVGQ